MLLKEILKSKGIKQKWLAEKVGVSEVTISNWVQQKSSPNMIHMKKLCDILGMSVEELSKHYGK
ncbi:helix-turn-helix transcriptional regulator [Membranihabitans maritimus]|uniref:helix-turn-helix transcriptional regulator n=1 Tax=Membranihabitans maritimus TaxID=2904244 RepID=UPI0034E22E9D